MAEQLIKLDKITDNPYQDRNVYLDIESLGRTIAMHDLQEKPKARSVNGHFELKFGHRRMRAFDWLSKNWKKEGLLERYSGYTVMPMDVEEISDADMFDGVVIENVHRDDLKVTEKARLLRRYKELHPEATSEQMGLVFNMNAATVRGMDIFLDLSEAVQSKLDDGTITQGTARLFHSMQKIAPEAKIDLVLKRIEKENGNSLPEEVIEEEIEHLDNVVDMWNSRNRDGKPRAGYHGWLLDMKNFPNHLLPTLTAVDAVNALGIQNDPKAMKQVAIWIEASLGKLPDIDMVGLVSDEHFEKLDHLINPPVCTACPFYTKIRGCHYCGVKLCNDRKTAAWKLSQLQDASKRSGIALYTEGDGTYRVLNENDKPLVEKKHKDLRLISGRGYQSFPGLDDDLVMVVATGDTLGNKEKAEMRAMKIYRVRRKELMWEFTGVAKSIFDSVPDKVIGQLLRWRNILMDDSIPEECKHGNAPGEYKRRELVWTVIMNDSSFYRRIGMATQLKAFEARTGVKPGKALLKLAQGWDAEIDAAAKVQTVAVGTGKKK